LDTSGTDPMINHQCIPEGAIISKSDGRKYITTSCSVFCSNEEIKLNYLCLPKFSFTCRFGNILFHVFDSPQCPYDVFLGEQRLFMAKTKLNFDSMETN
jgi:hypothetical protein